MCELKPADLMKNMQVPCCSDPQTPYTQGCNTFLITKYISETKCSHHQAASTCCQFYQAKDQELATLSLAQLPLEFAKKNDARHLSPTMEQPCSVCIHGY